MEASESKAHWNKIYQTKAENEFSWYQSVPRQSIEFFETFNLPKDAYIIDVGAGDSYFVDYLLDKGFNNVYVLDISAAAIERAKNRLGKRAEKVSWIVADIIDFKPEVKFDFWHDRAAFHFLTKKQERKKYLQNANSFIGNNRYLVVATFSDSGPLKCSGLEIKQYSRQGLENEFAQHFNKINCVDDTHLTPFNTNQNFTYCSFQKVS